MSNLIESAAPDYPAKLKVTTGSTESSSVYVFGEPNAEGIRTIQRNEDPEFQGKIVGPVMRREDVIVDKITFMTEFDDGRAVVIGDAIKVGLAMGVSSEHDPDNTLLSQPIASIEVL